MCVLGGGFLLNIIFQSFLTAKGATGMKKTELEIGSFTLQERELFVDNGELYEHFVLECTQEILNHLRATISVLDETVDYEVGPMARMNAYSGLFSSIHKCIEEYGGVK